MPAKCFFQGCENEADFIDDGDCYVCEDCMKRSLSENEYPGQEAEDFEKLDWVKYPELGYKQ